MAGAGYNSFTVGNVLTASQVNTFLMDQSVMKFDSAADRTTDLASPSQGMVSFLNDSGTTWIYYGLYNASTNPGGAAAAGWYPFTGSAVFSAVAGRSTTNNTVQNVGAASYDYTELTDTLAWHSAVTNPDRITPTVAGLYQITATCGWATNATGNRRLQLQKTGNVLGESRVSASTSTTNSLTFVVVMNGSTDYVLINTFQDSGGALTSSVFMTVSYLRPTTA